MAELKELRKFMNLTQKELAEKTGMNIRQIQKLEKGEIDVNNITAKNAQALSSALGCSVEDAKQSLKNGELDLHDLLRMDKYQKIKKLSKIGSFENTFYANYKWIPESLFDKLTPDELANLVDSFYDCYSAGKNAR